MSIDALARIYNELLRTALELERELDELPEGSEERRYIEDILKAILEITKSLPGVILESKSQDEDFSGEEISFRESVLRRLDNMLKRQNEPRKTPTATEQATADEIQEYESSKFEEALSNFESLSLPKSRIFDKSPLKRTFEKKSESTIEEESGFTSEVDSSGNVKRSVSQRLYEPQRIGRISNELAPIQSLTKSTESESSRTIFSSRYLEKSTTSSMNLKSASIEELAAYVMNEVLASIKSFKEIEPKRGVKLHGEDGSKISRRRFVSETSGISREDRWRRKKTRVLIEGMQDSLRESGTIHSLNPGEIRQALANSEFEEVADEFKSIYGKQIIRSDDNSLLRKITCQMDTVSSKIGESLAIDKMMNLLSVLKVEDKKCAANEQLMEYFDELDGENMTYLRAMLTGVKEHLSAEIAILSALSPPQRIAWMSIRENYEDNHICLSILGQLLQLQVVPPELNSIISSTMVMNLLDAVAILNSRDLLPININKSFCGYLKDEIEALSWFNVYIPELDEILKQLTEEYDDEYMGLLGAEENVMSPKPSIDKSLLDLVVSTGYTYVLHTGIGQEFSYSRADKQMGRISAVDYISDLRGKTLESQLPIQTFETELEEIKRTVTILENAETLEEALAKMSIYEPAVRTFVTCHHQVTNDKQSADAKEIFQLLTRSPYTQRKANLEKFQVAKVTDHEILRDLEETRHLICKRTLSKRVKIACIKGAKSTEETDKLDGKSDIKKEATNLQSMYSIRDGGHRKTSRAKLTYLPPDINCYQIPLNSGLLKAPLQSPKRCGKLHITIHDYPLTKEEIKAIENHLKAYTNNDEQLSEKNNCLPLEKQATDLNEKIVETLTKNPEAIHVLKRNPTILLKELRLKTKPGELTQILTDVVRKTGAKNSKKIFLRALQSAIIAVNETKQFTKNNSKHRLRGRMIKRPSEIPSRDWQRLAQTDTAEFEPLPAIYGKKVHCTAEYISRLGYANIIGSTRAYLTRLDILQHLHKADHLRANEHIHNSIEEW
nr:hypothetical transcript [Hymenolepis microstoma]